MKDLVFAVEYVAFGAGLRLTANSAELLQAMRECLPWSAAIGSCSAGAAAMTVFTLRRQDDGKHFRMLRDDVAIGEADSLDAAREQLRREMMVHVAEHAPGLTFVHAGVVEWRGRALLLPGRSFTGKSTLVAELVRVGTTYYSDEYAVIDEQGTVHPCARELQMREPGRTQQRSLAMCDLTATQSASPIPVWCVVFTEYADGGKWDPQPVSSGIAVLAMMEHAIAVQRSPARVMSTLAKVMETASAVRSDRGEASETAPLLLEMLSGTGKA